MRDASSPRHAMLALAAGGVIVILFGLAGAPLARLGFHLSGPSADDLGLAFVLASAGWLCQCLSAVFLALFTARQDYRRVASISIISTVVATASMLLFIPRWPQASTFLGCQALGFATSLLLAFGWSRRVIGDWLARPAIHRGAFGKLVKLGGWQLAAQGGALIAGQADRYLLGALLQPQFVGFYTIAQRLEEAMYIGVLKVGEILFPFFSTLQKEADDRKADLLFRSSWILNVLAASALGGLIPVAGPLLHLWTGAEVAAEAQHVLVILSIAGILGSSYERLCILSSGARALELECLDFPAHGRVHAGDQRDRLAVFRMAGGGMERVLRHDRPNGHHHDPAAAPLQPRPACGRV